MLENLNIPNHVAIILDGNGRWAKNKGMPRNYGHVQGAKTVETICEEAYRIGVRYLTVYAFSTENWNRPEDEVNALMKLLRNYLKTCLKTAEKNKMCVRILGDKTGLDDDIRMRIAELEEATRNNDGLHFQIALNYGGRDEIVRAVRKAVDLAVQGKIEKEEIMKLLLHLTKRRPVAIFGCGNRGERLMHFCNSNNIPIASFCDNNAALHGERKLGIRIISPKELKDELYNKNEVVILSMKEGKEQVKEQLLNLGIEIDRIIDEIPEGIL